MNYMLVSLAVVGAIAVKVGGSRLLSSLRASLEEEPKVDPRAVAPEKSVGAKQSVVPLSVNYFPHRQCNYACKFCFHTQKNMNILELEKAKEGLKMLADAGMAKLTFSGGEPFLKPKFLGELCKYAKVELGLESVGIICNGSKVRKHWMDEYGDYLDMLGVSCDSFDDATNIATGRSEKGKTHTQHVFKVSTWCHERGIPFKLNTVVNANNWQEDMNENIEKLRVARWKVFQVLILEGENSGTGDDLRNAHEVKVTNEQFEAFVKRHEKQACLVRENNKEMESSYLLVDEEMRFLNCKGGVKIPTESIFDAGVEAALEQAAFDEDMFVERGGIFEWSKDAIKKNGGCAFNAKPTPLEW